MAVYPAQWPAPKEPFIDIAEENGRKSVVFPDDFQELPNLSPPFRGPQSQMGGNDPHSHAVLVQVRIDCATRFAGARAEIPAMYATWREAREYGIAIRARRSHQRWTGNCREATPFAKIIEHVEALPTQRHLLQCNDIDVQFIDDVRDAFRIELPVAADAKMDIVGSESNFSFTAVAGTLSPHDNQQEQGQ